jgi:hypothetical protein
MDVDKSIVIYNKLQFFYTYKGYEKKVFRYKCQIFNIYVIIAVYF